MQIAVYFLNSNIAHPAFCYSRKNVHFKHNMVLSEYRTREDDERNFAGSQIWGTKIAMMTDNP